MDNPLQQASQDYVTGAKMQVVAGVDGNPDEAARNVQLEKATGIPSPVIAADPQQFEKMAQTEAATKLVSQNPQLMAYVHSHPMAAGVSSDDWGTLNDYSQKASTTARVLGALNAPWQRALEGGAKGALAGFAEGFGDLPTFSPGPTAAGNLMQSAGLLAQIINQGMSGAFSAMTQGVGGAVEGAASSFTDANTARSFGREAQAMTEYHMLTPGGDWVAAHEEPPKGINAHVDQAKADINKEALTHLDADFAAAQSSTTKERSPEMFQRLAEQHYGSATIGIHSDAALKLYGTKLPSPDDGLLGWVPGIADKLDAAQHTGADVEVPVSGWVSHVDPMVAEKLHDDLRMWPGGITAREAGEATPPTTVDELGQVATIGEGKEPERQGIPFEYKEMVDSPMAQVRGAYGLEPMFAMGDRKLTLERNDGTAEAPVVDAAGIMHGYDIKDEHGQSVGGLVVTPDGKNLTIENVSGIAGRWANAFGPSLMRDLLTQLKAQYPEAETLSGYRVSGARTIPEEVSVKLDASGENLNKAREMLASNFKDVGMGVAANLQPSTQYLAHEKEIASAIHEEISKITGGKAKVIPTAGLRYKDQAPAGAFLRSSRMGPAVFYDLLGDDPVGVARHESVHWLRDQGLITAREWGTLSRTAEEEGWHQRYGIEQRWGDHAPSEDLKTEESVAEAFREWARTNEEGRRTYSPVAQIFQKISDFLYGMMDKISALFGREPTAADLFEKIASGEVGAREGSVSSSTGPQFSMEEMDNLKADSLGLDRKSFANIQKMVQERYRADVEASQRQAEKEQAKRQTKEWKENSASLKPEVEQTIRQRPDVAADLFIGSGELYGEKIQQRFTLASGDLSAEQKATLPDHYVSKNGLPVDEVAKMFGYQSGDAMVARLGDLNLAKDGKSPKEFFKELVDREVDRQMEAKYGNLGENILTEAKDQALSKNDLNLLTEEYHAAALQAGVIGVDKDTILAKAKDMVSKTPLNEVDFNKQLTLVGRHYRDAVRALTNGDPASAVIALEKRTLAAHVASEMKKVTAEKAKFDTIAKRYAKRWDPTKPDGQAVEPNFSLFTRDILQRVGLRNGMSQVGLAKAISESPFKEGLSQFVNETEAEGKISGLELPVPGWLMSSTSTIPLDTMPVSQWREVKDAVTVMDKVGRADQKVLRAGEAQDRAIWVGDARQQLAKYFEPVSLEKKGAFRQAVSTAIAVTTSNETLMSRFDHRDPHGIFTETITKPGAEAANRKARLQRELAASYRELGQIKDPTKALESPLVDPRTQKPLPLDRRNLASIISNMGNNYNWSILTKGWKVDPEVLKAWVEKNSTPEDIERAQNLGKIFQGLKGEADKEYMHLYGIAPESVVPQSFQMHGKTYEGWYHPIIGDPQLSRFVNKMPELGAESNFWPSTSNAYMKRRTGAVQVVDLTYDAIPGKLDQIIHDISFRSFVSNTAKIFKDSRFREGVRTFYGKEYMEEMDQWLQRIAGDSSYNTSAMQLASKLSNTLRQNVISTQIAFNLGTMEKHGLTAGLMSARELSPNLLKSIPEFGKVFAEVAPSLFKRAVGDMFGHGAELGDSIFSFIKTHSEEIQRRERNFLDTVGGQHAVFEGKNTFRQQLTQWGAKGVAFSDMLSAAPLWLAKYRAEMEASGIHGDAVREADMAVRRAHGSTAVTNLPRIAANSGPVTPWLTSLYGFMGTSMQRRIEIFHDVNDAYKLGMQGQIREAAKMVPSILSSVGVYVLYTGAVEELISGQFTDDRRGLGSKALTFLFGSVAQSIIGLRDLVYDLESGRESAGLVSTPINDLIHLKRDIQKNQPLARNHAGQLLQDGCTAIGDLGGLCPKHLGTIGHYGLDVFNGFQHPRTLGDTYRGVVSGKQQLHVVK